MKRFLLLFFLFSFNVALSQEIIGKWQLVKQTTCLDDELGADSETEEEMLAEMDSRAGSIPQIIEFRDNNTARESTRIINRRKTYNSNALLYKFTGSALHFLDKKSRMIIDSFTVEQLSTDSLIISNVNRVCETRVFVKIR